MRRSRAPSLSRRVCCGGAASLFTWRTLLMSACAAASSTATSTRPCYPIAIKKIRRPNCHLGMRQVCTRPLPLWPLPPCALPLMTPSMSPYSVSHILSNTLTNTLYTLTHTHTGACAHTLHVPPAPPLFLSLSLSEYNDYELPSSHPSLRAKRSGLDPLPPDAAAAAAAGQEWLPFGIPEEAAEGEARRCGSLWLSQTRIRGHVWHTDSRPWRFYCDAPDLT